jgi:hypothetical protein
MSFLLSRLILPSSSLLATRNRGISQAEKPRVMRLRAVIHADEVYYDGKKALWREPGRGVPADRGREVPDDRELPARHLQSG